LEDIYTKIVDAHPEAYHQMVARLHGKSNSGNSSAQVADGQPSMAKIPWWKTEAGRAAHLAEVERINEINRRNMLQPSQPSQPNQPYQPYQPLLPGQPPR
jgi:hypothetical protein